jgi:hypothetical protein|tara:strand:- start:303 stop:716 length:414 start_codon:yes stop_codon:yes gene_type:complete
MKKIIFILLISINITYSQGGGQMFVIEDPAVLSLKFPLQVGTEWTAKSDDNFTVLKEVIGRETLIINGNEYDCLIVERIMPNLVITNVVTSWNYSWIAKEGLIKRVYFQITTHTDVNGSEYTDTYTDELILTDIDLK